MISTLAQAESDDNEVESEPDQASLSAEEEGSEDDSVGIKPSTSH